VQTLESGSASGIGMGIGIEIAKAATVQETEHGPGSGENERGPQQVQRIGHRLYQWQRGRASFSWFQRPGAHRRL